MILTKSKEIHKRAVKVIPGGISTISKNYDRFPPSAPPAIKSAKGCKIWDYDGNEYTDWSASLGPIILGYNFFDYEAKNTLYPMQNHLEVELAEKLIDIIPCAEMVRFFKNGSDATSAAVRLSRYMGGSKQGNGILCSGYHGWHDWYSSTLPMPKRGGVIGFETTKIPYGDLKVVESFFAQFNPSCFILEPMSRLTPELASKEYLQGVRNLCDKYNVILIFDEVIMGFRHAIAGGQELYGVVPDLATYSKAMGNGFPISCLVGKRSLMKEIKKLQVSATFCCDVLPMKAALDTIDFIEKNDVIFHLNHKGEILKRGLEEKIHKNGLTDLVKVKGFGPWNKLEWKEEYKDEERIWWNELFQLGMFYSSEHFMMWSHKLEDVLNAIERHDIAFSMLKDYRKLGMVKDKIKEMDKEMDYVS